VRQREIQNYAAAAIRSPPDRGPRTPTAASGASYLYRSANGGQAWQRITYFDGGPGFRDLAYVTAATGYLIHFSGRRPSPTAGPDADHQRGRGLEDRAHPLTQGEPAAGGQPGQPCSIGAPA